MQFQLHSCLYDPFFCLSRCHEISWSHFCLSLGGFWWREKHPAPVNTCANSLREVMCPSRYHIHIRNIWSQSEGTQSDCDSMDTNCSTNTLKRLCNENRRCMPDTTKTSCLFHQRFANIQFSCRSKHFTILLYWLSMLIRQPTFTI